MSDIEMSNLNSEALATYFFRNQYGKILAVVSRYLGMNNLEHAEDIVQETFLKAYDYWKHQGIPANPEAWLYLTAKNLVLNLQKKQDYAAAYLAGIEMDKEEDLLFSDDVIADDQLRMIFASCHPSLNEASQIAIILKILCGFSILEIADAFYTNREVINKRLLRARKKMKEVDWHKTSIEFDQRLPAVLKAIYLLFNEGYSPRRKNQVIRIDFCLEAVRLGELLADHPRINQKSETYSLLALMYMNVSRFKARKGEHGQSIELKEQDRSLWDHGLINRGLHFMHEATKLKSVSTYLLLAMISANHCLAKTYQLTNWKEILALYDSLLLKEDNLIVRLNRCIVLIEANMLNDASSELEFLGKSSKEVKTNTLFYSVKAELQIRQGFFSESAESLKLSIDLCENERDKLFLKNKLTTLSLF